MKQRWYILLLLAPGVLLAQMPEAGLDFQRLHIDVSGGFEIYSGQSPLMQHFIDIGMDDPFCSTGSIWGSGPCSWEERPVYSHDGMFPFGLGLTYMLNENEGIKYSFYSSFQTNVWGLKDMEYWDDFNQTWIEGTTSCWVRVQHLTHIVSYVRNFDSYRHVVSGGFGLMRHKTFFYTTLDDGPTDIQLIPAVQLEYQLRLINREHFFLMLGVSGRVGWPIDMPVYEIYHWSDTYVDTFDLDSYMPASCSLSLGIGFSTLK